MVIRVLAGVVPMICGALIFSGVIPVGQWVMGSAAPNPVDVIRTMTQAEEFARVSGTDRGSDGVRGELSPAQVTALTPAQQAAYRAQLARARALGRQQSGESGGSSRGWAPSGGGWGR